MEELEKAIPSLDKMKISWLELIKNKLTSK